jgi:hypothetical protein
MQPRPRKRASEGTASCRRDSRQRPRGESWSSSATAGPSSVAALRPLGARSLPEAGLLPSPALTCAAPSGTPHATRSCPRPPAACPPPARPKLLVVHQPRPSVDTRWTSPCSRGQAPGLERAAWPCRRADLRTPTRRHHGRGRHEVQLRLDPSGNPPPLERHRCRWRLPWLCSLRWPYADPPHARTHAGTLRLSGLSPPAARGDRRSDEAASARADASPACTGARSWRPPDSPASIARSPWWCKSPWRPRCAVGYTRSPSLSGPAARPVLAGALSRVGPGRRRPAA